MNMFVGLLKNRYHRVAGRSPTRGEIVLTRPLTWLIESGRTRTWFLDAPSVLVATISEHLTNRADHSVGSMNAAVVVHDRSASIVEVLGRLRRADPSGDRPSRASSHSAFDRPTSSHRCGSPQT